ncbi:hypothetical protein EIN_495740 [Entamoeba invadens IP1]|uniref:Uncharacterized protein n=1 Tax=Entamoeba invadens IP1 TaxID=370355 RepID=A0A0A1TZR9_ENTIV|nr:hypothetical protein EIN_495740 [Entamoeba invadens IP1]ELP87109.1 hypothetical protein EIN_495740 [Entamoeba invadens IP1]|eukprot:XP_004253880.1 hypothetical protein EIN_495740 [Entamoeba invadens IP1]
MEGVMEKSCHDLLLFDSPEVKVPMVPASGDFTNEKDIELHQTICSNTSERDLFFYSNLITQQLIAQKSEPINRKREEPESKEEESPCLRRVGNIGHDFCSDFYLSSIPSFLQMDSSCDSESDM